MASLAAPAVVGNAPKLVFFFGRFRDVAPITTNLLTKQINPISGQQRLRRTMATTAAATTTSTVATATTTTQASKELSCFLGAKTISASARLKITEGCD